MLQSKIKCQKGKITMTIHPIRPIYDKNSKILILGSFPSVKSREEKFFYAHAQNRFWRVVSAVFEKPVPESIAEKKAFLIDCGIALWDVVQSCEISASSDSSIKNVTANDISPILKSANIQKIFTNGKTADKYYNKYIKNRVKISALCLPSTSAANAAWSLKQLTDAWSVINFNLSDNI